MTLVMVSEIDETYRSVVSEDVVSEVRRLLRAVPATEGSSLGISEKSRERTHSILELEGLGKEIWVEVDPRKYIDDLRNEWDR